MEGPLTFLELAALVIETVKRPLSDAEIWEEALKLVFSKRVNTKGKTPWKSIGAPIYVDIRDNPASIFIQQSKRPVKFYLKKLGSPAQEIISPNPEQPIFYERDLHPLVARFINANQHFKAYVKTIFHEGSSGSKKGANEWLHPDIVGVYLPFSDYDEVTLRVQKSLSLSSVKLFSFELKRELNFSNLRRYYFQAVSNSSWAHEGYLVVAIMSDDSDLIDELRRLNNAFGVGLIRLNLESIDESEILFQSRMNPELDWDTINRLIEENPDFRQFMTDIQEDLQLGKVKGKYDIRFDDPSLKSYIEQKGFKCNYSGQA